MNTTPDELKLALWLDDELAGEDKTAMDLWAKDHPEQLAAREEIRSWRSGIAAALPASVEPPYPDFFNSRVAQAIRDQTPREAAPAVKKPFWKSFLIPAAACAGMALAFWTGTQTKPASSSMAGISLPDPAPPEPAVYTPENGVDAKWFSSREASATVIVLQGVNAIPDSTDFSETVYVPMSRESDSTAGGVVKPETETPE